MCAHIGEDGSQHTHKEVQPGQHLQRCERPRKCEPAIIIEPRRQEMPAGPRSVEGRPLGGLQPGPRLRLTCYPEHQHSELSQQNVAGPLP